MWKQVWKEKQKWKQKKECGWEQGYSPKLKRSERTRYKNINDTQKASIYRRKE